jgi:hypothetical protein
LTETTTSGQNSTITSSSRYRSDGETQGTASLSISQVWTATAQRTVEWGKLRHEWPASDPVGLYGSCPPLSGVASPAKPSALSAVEGLGAGVEAREGLTGWILSWADVRPLDPTFEASEDDPGPRYLGGYVIDGDALGGTFLTATSVQIFLAPDDNSCRQFSVASDAGWSAPFYFHGGSNSCCPTVDPNLSNGSFPDWSPWYSSDGLAHIDGSTFVYEMSHGEESDSASGKMACDDFPAVVGGLVLGQTDGPWITTSVDKLTEDGWDMVSVWPHDAEEVTDVEAEDVEMEDVSATDVVMGAGGEIVSAALTTGSLRTGNLVTGSLGPAKTLSGGRLRMGTLSGGGLSGGTLSGGTLSGGTLSGGKISGTTASGSTAENVSLDGTTEETEGTPEEEETSPGWYASGSSVSKRQTQGFRRTLGHDMNQGLARLGSEFSRAQAIASGYGALERWGKTYAMPGATVPGAFAKGTFPVWGASGVAITMLFRQMRYRWSVSTEIPGLYKIVWSIGEFSEQHLAWRSAYHAWAVAKYDFLHQPAGGEPLPDPGAAPAAPGGGFAPVVVTADLEWEWTPAQGERGPESVGVCDPTYAARVPQPPVLPDDPTPEESEAYAEALEAYNEALEARREASTRQSAWYAVTPGGFFRDVIYPPLPAPLPTDPPPTSAQVAIHARQTAAHTALKAEHDAIPRRFRQVCDVRYVCNPNGPAGEIVTYDLGFPQTEIPPLDPANENPRLWTAWWT